MGKSGCQELPNTIPVNWPEATSFKFYCRDFQEKADKRVQEDGDQIKAGVGWPVGPIIEQGLFCLNFEEAKKNNISPPESTKATGGEGYPPL